MALTEFYPKKQEKPFMGYLPWPSMMLEPLKHRFRSLRLLVFPNEKLGFTKGPNLQRSSISAEFGLPMASTALYNLDTFSHSRFSALSRVNFRYKRLQEKTQSRE